MRLIGRTFSELLLPEVRTVAAGSYSDGAAERARKMRLIGKSRKECDLGQSGTVSIAQMGSGDLQSRFGHKAGERHRSLGQATLTCAARGPRLGCRVR